MSGKSVTNKAVCFFPSTLALLVIAAAFAIVAPAVSARAAEQKSYVSPQQAIMDLAAAVQEDNDAGLTAIFGPGSEDLISSGDGVADRNGRARFLKAYEEKNRLEHESPVKVVLYIGAKDYPFPIPIVQQGNVWLFDTEAGKEEILNRRIGRNELRTIEVLQAYTEAQRSYAAVDRTGNGCPEFAQQFTSSEGKKDGLYWQAAEGEEESPFGPLIARAARSGYAGDMLDSNGPEPFHGYYFKILKAQGEHANGGAFDYVVDGRMILGFALVAYPARYGSTGIMTFMVSHEGVIYEKDLDEKTHEAGAMTVYDPDGTWRRYEEPIGR